MRARQIAVDHLGKLLAERDLSMAELARRSGVSYSLIKYVFAGTFQFSDRKAHAIALALSAAPIVGQGLRPVAVEDFSTPKADVDHGPHGERVA